MAGRDRWSNLNPIDKSSNAGITIEYDHHKIHEGDKFYAFVQFTMLTGTTQRVTFKTPSDRYIHYQKSGVSTSADKVTINFYEDATVDVEGTDIAISNRNLLSTKTSGVELRSGDTYTSIGTKLDAFTGYLAGSESIGQVRTGGTSEAGEEIILKQDTVYVYEIVNGSAGTNVVSVNYGFYMDGYALN